tara:strand:- start:2777 stop:3253 length:477 start_codon:yes stop_codon:yes gene_type:complete
MSVFLSPIGGAGWQFFDNNGNVLTGGKLYTYVAGTTTPLASYTSSAGNTAHTNPIILDAAGRVPGGEIWLSSARYKFALYTSVNVLIATYDNIAGAGALLPISFTGNGSTVAYSVSGNVVSVYINGVYQNENTYSVSGTTLTFTQAPPFTSSIEILSN